MAARNSDIAHSARSSSLSDTVLVMKMSAISVAEITHHMQIA
jgi:hypothetical protein